MRYCCCFGAILVVLFNLIRSAPSLAEPTDAQKALLGQASRPTIAEVEAIYFDDPAAERFSLETTAYEGVFDYRKVIAEFIVSFEEAFPGGTYAFLGRDVVLFADYLDAFYRGIGQPERVKRINLSKESFAGASNADLVEVLRTAGVDFENVMEKPSFLIFDFTSYLTTSQSRRLLVAGYEKLQQVHAGIDTSAFFRKLNVVSSGTASHDAYWKYVRPTPPTGEPDRIPYVTFNRRRPDNLGFPFWHDSFGAVHRNALGGVEGTPGALMSAGERLFVLSQLSYMITVARSAAFHRLVYGMAATRKVDFRRQRPEAQQELPHCEGGFGL